MSAKLYDRLLQWEGLRRVGWVKVPGHTAEIIEHPPLLHQLLDIFYRPEVRHIECREDFGPKRELYPHEVEEIEGYLAKLEGEWRASLMTPNRRRP